MLRSWGSVLQQYPSQDISWEWIPFYKADNYEKNYVKKYVKIFVGLLNIPTVM